VEKVKEVEVGNGEFEKTVREAVGDAVLRTAVEADFSVPAVKGKGIVAGVIEIAGITDGFKNGVGNGEAGRAIPVNRAAGDIFEEAFAVPEVVFQGLRGHLRAEVMTASMGGDFVAAKMNFANKVREAFGDPAEGEEGGLRSSKFEVQSSKLRNRSYVPGARWQRKKLSGCAAGRRDSETARIRGQRTEIRFQRIR